MKIVAKRLLALALVLLALSVIGAGVQHELETRATRKRQSNYELTLRSYQQVLKPGMTRKEVESYLHQRSGGFGQMCCVGARELAPRSSWDDLVKIGEEKAPWYCGANNVYIAFEFADHEQRHDYVIRDNDLDILRAITIYHQLEDCL